MTDADAVSLKHYLERLFDEHRRVDAAVWAGHRREHEELALALQNASKDLREWKAESREWRDTLTDLKGEFARVDGMAIERQRSFERRLWLIGVAVSIMVSLISFAVRYLAQP